MISNLRPQLEALHFTEGAKQELAGLIDLFAYNDPLLLLISAVQQAFDGNQHRPSGTAPTDAVMNSEKRPVLLTKSPPNHVRRVFEGIPGGVRDSPRFLKTSARSLVGLTFCESTGSCCNLSRLAVI